MVGFSIHRENNLGQVFTLDMASLLSALLIRLSSFFSLDESIFDLVDISAGFPVKVRL